MMIGVDWGGTKIEFVALDRLGAELLRKRMPTPSGLIPTFGTHDFLLR